MNILIIGDEQRYKAFLTKGGTEGHNLLWMSSMEEGTVLQNQELVIDLNFDEQQQRAALYAMHPRIPVLACIVKTTLAAIADSYSFSDGFNIIGCNWLPGFIAMQVMEISLLNAMQAGVLATIMEQLGWEYEVVQDAVGMVTPRVVTMIINEAYMAVEAGTATREDIDIAMRFGTNYPKGPFEWSHEIGIEQVYTVLSAVHAASRDARYIISPLLEQEANKQS